MMKFLIAILKILLLLFITMYLQFLCFVLSFCLINAGIIIFQLPTDLVRSTLPSIINLLTAKNTVVHTYAAFAIERVFTMKKENGAAWYVF